MYERFQGKGDNFLSDGQLLTDHLERACATAGQAAKIRLHDGYNHSYFFMASFMEEHLDHHAKFLK